MQTDIRQLVIEINDAFEKSDLKYIGDHLTNDVHWHILGRDKPLIGREAFLEACGPAPLLPGEMKITLVNILVAENHAAAEGTIEGTTAAGKSYLQKFADFYEFEGDKMKVLSSYLDTAYGKEHMGC